MRVVGRVDVDAASTERLSQQHEVARRRVHRQRLLVTLEHLGADLAVAAVVEDDDRHGQLLGRGDRELGGGEQQPAVAGDADDLSVGSRQR